MAGKKSFVVSTRDVDGSSRKSYRTVEKAVARFESMLGYSVGNAIDETFYDKPVKPTFDEIVDKCGRVKRRVDVRHGGCSRSQRGGLMKFELNIGLNVAGSANRTADINARAEMAARMVAAKFGNDYLCRRVESEYPDPAGKIVSETTLVVAVDTVRVNANWIVYNNVEVIAAALEQDCIAVYFPDAAFGKLIGLKTAAWGAFNLEYFKRFEREVV